MKGLAVIVLCVTFVVVVLARPDEDSYAGLEANVDIDEVLRNNRLRLNYFKCFKTGKGCTPQANKVKDVIPEALTTGCKKCTDTQKVLSKKVLRIMIKDYPKDFLELEHIYDSERKYRNNYAKELSDEGIVLPN